MEGRRIGAFYDQAANTIKQSASDQARAAEQKVGAVSAEGQSAKEMAAAVSEVGTDATNYETHREISIGAKNFATLHDNLTNQWNQAASNADPNDPSVVGKFRDQMEDKLQDFTEDGFLTPAAKEWAQGQVARLRDHMFEKTSADMSSMAMDAVKQNTMVITNKSADSVFNDPSPHNLDMVLGNIKSSVGAMADSSPTLTFADRARIKTEVPQQMGEQVMKSWIYSAAKANPDAAEAVLKSGKYSQFITGADAKQIVSMAKSSRDNDRVMQDRQDKQNFFGAANKIELQFDSGDPNAPMKLPDNFHEQLIKLSSQPGANTSEGSAKLRSLMDLNNAVKTRLDKGESDAKINQDTLRDLIPRIGATDNPVTDPSEITSLFKAGKLTTAGYTMATKAYQDSKTPDGETLARDRGDFFKRYELSIDPSRHDEGPTALGNQRVYIAQQDAMRQEDDLRRQGKNPHDVYDPRSPSFFGRPENIAKYQGSLQDMLRQPAAAAPANNEPAPKVNDRKQFKQGWGVWNGSQWVAERPDVPAR